MDSESSLLGVSSRSRMSGNSSRSGVNLVKMQKEVLESILKVSRREEEQDGCVWKVLIFDSFTSSILSTLLKVGNLRDLNVTLHLHINQKSEKRDRLHGVKAYYFVQPTQENIQCIMDDFTKDLYDQVYIVFSSPAESSLLKDLAIHVGSINAVYKIKRVVQYTINFITMTPDLFTLNIPNSYAQAHQQAVYPSNKPLVDAAAMGLFSLFRTMKKVPVILYQQEDKNNALLARAVDELFERFYVNSKEHEEEQSDFINHNQSAPLLILAERDSDVGSQLLHPWLYGALVHDTFQIESNKIRLKEGENTEACTYDLDCSTEDSYWVEKISLPYPDVAEEISDRLAKFEIEFKQMMAKKDDPNSLVAALGGINEMKDKKRLIAMHMSMTRYIMSELKLRRLDKLFEIGSYLIHNKSLRGQDKKDLLEVFTDMNNSASVTGKSQQAAAKMEMDKLRMLLLVLIFASKDIESTEFAKLEVAAELTNKKHKQIIEQFKLKYLQDYAQEVSTVNTTEEASEKLVGSILGKFADKMKSQGKGLLKNVKNYLPGSEQDFPLAVSVRNLIESKCIAFDKLGYAFLDILNKRNKTPPKIFSEVVVFVLDGANLNEYSNLQEVAKKLNKPIIYGGSEILNAEMFVQQLAPK